MKNIRSYEINEIESPFSPAEALEGEKNFLSNLRVHAKDIAKVLILVSGLIFGEGTTKISLANEPIKNKQEAADKMGKLSFKEFILIPNEIKLDYLGQLSAQDIDKLKDWLKEKVQFDHVDNDERQKEINDSFLIVHRYCLENCINWDGQQAIAKLSYKQYEDIQDFIDNYKKEKNIYINENIDLGDEGGENLNNIYKEIDNLSGSELSKIKKIYNLVALKVPFYQVFKKEDFQNWNEMLSRKAGQCLEKNSLFINLLRHAGLKADYVKSRVNVMGGPHIYTRVFTDEGILDLDVTDSIPFTLINSAVDKKYMYQSWHSHQDFFDIKLSSRGNLLGLIAQENGITIGEVKEVLIHLNTIKSHPLYHIYEENNGPITPASAGKYAADLFPNIIDK